MRLRRRWLPGLAILIVVLGAALTAVLVRTAWRDVLRDHERLFDVRTEAVHDRLLERIKASDEVVSALATFVNSATKVDAEQFRLFSEELQRRHPFVQSTVYLPRVADEDRAEFERSRRQAGFPRFAVHDRVGTATSPAARRTAYYPLLYVEPYTPLSVVLIGQDVMSDARLRPGAQAAIDTGEPGTTAPGATEADASTYWVFSASYAARSPPRSVAERRATVNALLGLRIDGAKLLAEALAALPVAARLRMVAGGAAQPIDIASIGGPRDRRGDAAVAVFDRSADIGIGRQRFRLDLSQPIAWTEVNYAPLVALTATGVLATFGLALAAWRMARRSVLLEQRTVEIERRVREKTAELALEKERAQVTLASIGDAVITTGADGRIEYLNGVAEKLTGWSTASARGRALGDVYRVRASGPGAAAGSERSPARREGLLVSRSLHEIAINQSVAPICGRGGEVLGSVVVFHDVSVERRLAQEMAYQGSHDAMTGLLNRHAFEERLAQLLAGTQGVRGQHALLYIDLDQFKIVNDACGHSAGDQLLRELSALLRKDSRQTDALARLGGDEFGVLLPHCPLADAAKVAHKLLQAVNDFRFVWQERAFVVGASIGVVPFDAQSDSVTSVMSAADVACYAAKDKGRNRVTVYQADDVELSQRRTQMQWVTRLRKALEEDRFVLFSQPIVPIGRAVADRTHHEVLLRLREDDGTLVPPGAFLPSAERYGLMPEVDRWVVRACLRWLAEHAHERGAAGNYSINLSGQSLSDPSFLKFLLHEVEHCAVDPSRVSFEITETTAVTVGRDALQAMQSLRQRGCRFLLDDFGSGWSSFAYLKALPVDFLKIDGSLVRDIAHDILDEAMVRAINEIGHALGIATIAEFVEDEEVLERLQALGVDFAQGYAIGRPAPLAAHLRAARAETAAASA